MAGHDSGKALMVLGYKVGGFNQSFTVYATHILAPERQIEPMMDGLRHGHTYVSFDLMGFVPNFALYAESSGARTLMGDSVVLSPDISLKAELPGAADEIRILQNGKIVAKGSV